MGIASAPLEMQLIVMPCIIFALTFHEYAHARVAYYLGDYTAYYQDRMNLNPFSHLDPIGTLALYFLGFGWAKPVPVNMRNLSNPRKDMMLIAIAGPASNILLATIGSLFLRFSTIAPFNIPELFYSAMVFFIFINIAKNFYFIHNQGIFPDLIKFCNKSRSLIVSIHCQNPVCSYAISSPSLTKFSRGSLSKIVESFSR